MAAILAASALLLPTVLAAAPLTARSLDITGALSATGPAGALFFVSGTEGATWSAVAANVRLVQEYKSYTNVAGKYTSYDAEPTVVTSDLGAATVTSGAFRDGGAILARLLGATMDATISTRAGAAATAVTDPRVDQGPPPTVGNSASSPVALPGGGGRVSYTIHDALTGEFVNLTASGAQVELRGTLTLRLFDADYLVAAKEGAVKGRTGTFETDATGPVSHGRTETDTLTLTDVVLTFAAPSPVTLFAKRADVAFDGALSASDATGALPLSDTLTSDAPGRWTGEGALVLTPDAGRILVAPDPHLALAGARVGRAASPYLWVAIAAGALALVAVAVVLVLRRRATPGDDLELALLAMEERRWDDALPHLDRILAAAPADATVLVDRALCLEEAGRLEDARAGYESALRVAPFHAEAHYYYARTLARLRLSTAALAHLSRALTLDARLAELARGERAFAAFADHPQFVGLVR